MENFKTILLILAVLLTGSTLIFFIQASTARNQVEQATKLSTATLALLQTQGFKCAANSNEFERVANCVSPALEIKNFKMEAFTQPDEKKETQGFLVVKNVNAKTYTASDLILLVNRVTSQTGCSNIQEGAINKGVTCRFALENRCEKGDVLEIVYPAGNDTTTVFMMNC